MIQQLSVLSSDSGGSAVSRGTPLLACLVFLAIQVASLRAQPASTDPALVGRWSGESISDAAGIQRWVIERRADGSYESQRFAISPTRQVTNVREIGTWTASNGVVSLVAQSGSASRETLRYSTHSARCIRMESIDAASGLAVKPRVVFGECRLGPVHAVPDPIQLRCGPAGAFPQTSSVNLRIALERDGSRYATVDGDRDPVPVEWRDYPVLDDFRPRRPETATNAGEVVLNAIAQSAGSPKQPSGGQPFDAQLARTVRLYVLKPARPERPMDYFGGGRVVLAQAFDRAGQTLGYALHAAPFVLACAGAGETAEPSSLIRKNTAPAPESIVAEIYEEGTYELRGRGFAGTAPDSAAGHVTGSDEVRLLTRESSLKAVQGASFGFKYRLSGLGDEAVDGLEMRTTHPPMSQPGRPSKTVSSYEFSIVPDHGVYEGRLTYSLDEPFEVLPGEWTLQVLYRGKVLLSRTFTLR